MNIIINLLNNISKLNIQTLLVYIIPPIIMITPIIDLIHEIGHSITIILTKPFTQFKNKVNIYIGFKAKTIKTNTLKTYSDFYLFLNNSNKDKLKTIIRINALSGIIAETIFTISLITLSYKYIKLIILLIYIGKAIHPFLIRENISTSDFYILKYPNLFKYTTLEEDIENLNNNIF